MSSPPVVLLRDLRFRRRDGDFELRIPALTVEAGERVAVIGPSGSGKTTLLQLVAGIHVPEEGRVETAGAVLTSLDDGARRAFRIRNVGLVFQEFELLDYLSVLDNVLLPYRLNPAQRLDASARARAEALLRRVGLGDEIHRLAPRLSHGERQRAAVCRALVTEPPLLLADEPTGNLDPANRDRVLDILCDVASETGATLLTVTHDHEVLHRFGRVIDFRSLRPGREAAA